MFTERVVLEDGVVFELELRSPAHYRLACLKHGQVLVESTPARQKSFTSVEKLRYDFERDAEDALRRG